MTSLPAKPPRHQDEAEIQSDFIPLSESEDHVELATAAQSQTDGSPSDEGQSSRQSHEPPPLPAEEPPPLPNEPPPGKVKDGDDDDGWEPVWDNASQAFYFYNRKTKVTQWDNPRVPDAVSQGPTDTGPTDTGPPGAAPQPARQQKTGGYNPAIHGDYDPNADYARGDTASNEESQAASLTAQDPSQAYAATGSFNRFTGKWQRAELNPENFNDENKSHRQMSAFFDVDAAANSHDGKSLKAERANKKLSKKELKAFKEKRREKKEEKRRAWLRD